MYTIFSLQILGGLLLLVIILILIKITFLPQKTVSNNLPLKIYCKNIMNIHFSLLNIGKISGG